MTYTTLEALRLAEEAFMKIADLRNLGKINPEVIAFETLYTIRAARAQKQAEQEPVAWAYCPECGSFDVRYEEGSHKQCARCFQEWYSDVDYSGVVQQNLNRLYAAPVRTKDLTDDEILSIPYLGTGELKTSMVNFARAAIAADREKNKC